MYYCLHLNSQVTGQAIDMSYDFLENQMKSMKKEHRNIEKIEREWLKSGPLIWAPKLTPQHLPPACKNKHNAEPTSVKVNWTHRPADR